MIRNSLCVCHVTSYRACERRSQSATSTVWLHGNLFTDDRDKC
jgi:hypothetical protein